MRLTVEEGRVIQYHHRMARGRVKCRECSDATAESRDPLGRDCRDRGAKSPAVRIAEEAGRDWFDQPFQ